MFKTSALVALLSASRGLAQSGDGAAACPDIKGNIIDALQLYPENGVYDSSTCTLWMR